MKEESVLVREFKNLLLSDDEQRMILSGYQKRNIKKGTLLVKSGKIVDSYYLVEKGFLRSYVIDIEGNEVTTNFYSKGSIVLEEMSFFMKTPTKENIQVVEDAVLWVKDFNTFQEHFNASEKYREWGRSHLSKNSFEFKERILAVITETASERYLNLVENSPEIIQKASLKNIASFLGITDTSLSRIRKEITK